MKRAVKITFKDSGESRIFANRKRLVEECGEANIGITYNALCNAVKIGKTYENKKVIIEETKLLDIE